ncbi:DUF3987 domain-containing protein [Burkholderia cepacia]|uniref:DUF3987 domain-containing protein n=1 Tax=Burkholderia cepacia TaxID=292 RepID=UPI002FE0BC23
MNGYLLPGVDTDVGTGLPQIAGTRFQRVFDELRHNCCAADELTLFLLLGMTTFACQDGAFVRLRNGTLSPLTGYFIVSAPPASGKSTVLTRLSQPFGQAEIEAKEGGAQLRRHYRAKRVVCPPLSLKLRQMPAISSNRGGRTKRIYREHVLEFRNGC